MSLRAAHIRCRTYHYRTRREDVCELGVVDKPALCPRMRACVRVPLLREAGWNGAEQGATKLK